MSGPGAGPRRVGLFGGSFDPVHAGHRHAARAAREAFELERVHVVPARRPPHKPGRALAPGEDRARMLELAFEGDPWAVVDRRELGREGPSFTIDTVRELAREYGGPEAVRVHMVLGSDNLVGLEGWRDVEELLAAVQPVVVHREGAPEPLLARLAGRLSPAALAALERGLLRLPPVEAAATALRARLGAGAEPGPELDPRVREYIRARGLYRPPERG